MFGKLVLGAVLCVFVAQVCLAAPQQGHEEVADSEGPAETRITVCRQNLRNVIMYVSNIVYHASALLTEVLASVSDGLRCAMRPSELLQCLLALVIDTFQGISEATINLIINITSLVGAIAMAVGSCVIPTGMRSRDLFLLSNNHHEF